MLTTMLLLIGSGLPLSAGIWIGPDATNVPVAHVTSVCKGDWTIAIVPDSETSVELSEQIWPAKLTEYSWVPPVKVPSPVAGRHPGAIGKAMFPAVSASSCC